MGRPDTKKAGRRRSGATPPIGKATAGRRAPREWAFRLVVLGPPRSEDGPARVLLERAVAWAELHRFGIGGGFVREARSGSTRWRFAFGLCATRAGQRVPERKAAELLDLLSRDGARRGCRLSGRFRLFRAAEQAPL